jgi:hypothetical protein
MLKNVNLIIFIFISLFTTKAFALMELNTEFGYTRQVYGEQRENKLTERTYAGSVATRLFGWTSLELNFTYGEQITQQADNANVTGTDINLVSYQNTVENTVYGIGLKQALSDRNSRIRPSISLGYARQFIYDRTDYTYRDTSNGNTILLFGTPEKRRIDSVFGTFSLQIGLTQRIGLSGSVRTVFPAFETDKMKDYVRYTVGIIIYI